MLEGWGKMVNSIWDFIQVTTDCPGNYPGGMVPILDLQCRMETVVEQWGEFQQIIWRFYEKPMNSPYCIMSRSAMADQIKVTTCV